MRPAYTYALAAAPKNTAGIALSDVKITVNGRNYPASFEKQGDTIDLHLVDLPSFVRSSLIGDLLKMESRGTLRRVAQEVPEKLFDALSDEMSRQQAARPIRVDRSIPGRIFQLEPGVQVAVGTGDLTMPPPQGERPVQEIEAGMTGPSGAPETASTPVEATPAKVVRKKATAAAPVAAPVVVTEKTWKTGKSFQEQERLVKTSSEPGFLNQVIADPGEKKRIILAAKKRLKAIQ